MGKQLIRVGIVMMFLAVTAVFNLSDNVYAKEQLEQVYINSPIIQTYITGENEKDSTEIEPNLTFDGDEIKYNSDIHFFDSKKDGGTEYIYAIEISQYVTKKQRKVIAQTLKKQIDSLQSEDVVKIYGFGDKFAAKPGIEIGVNASNDQKKQAKTKVDVLLKQKEKTSHLWNAVVNVTNIINAEGNSPRRRVVVCVTGGNYKKSTSDNDENTARQQMKEMSKNAAFYMVQLKTKSKVDGSEASAFQDNGGIKLSEKSGISLKKCFEQLNLWWKKTMVATFQASDSTVFDKSGEITLTLNGKAICENQKIAQAYNWQENTTQPTVEKLVKETDNSLSFIYSEPMKGAEVIKNYTVTRSDNQKVEIESLKYDVKTYKCVLTFAQNLFTDDYKVAISNVTDVDHSPHTVTPTELSAHIDGVSESTYSVLQFLKTFWWAILIGTIIIILLVVYFVIKSHGGIVEQASGKMGFGNATTVTVGISTPKTKKIMLLMTDSYGKQKEIVCNIDSSIFVGRDKMCQIHTDDDKMSRQHFAIESTQLGFYIMDLDTLNGTTVNGVRLTERQLLKEGDVITAGREKFEFSIYKESEKRDLE